MAQPIDGSAPQFGNEGVPSGAVVPVNEVQGTTTSSQQVTSQLIPSAMTTETRTYSQTTSQGPIVEQLLTGGHNYYAAATGGYQGAATSYQSGASSAYQQGAASMLTGGGVSAANLAAQTTASGAGYSQQSAYSTTAAYGATSSTPAVYSTGGAEFSYATAGQSASQGVYSSSQVIRGTSGVTEHSRVIGHEYGQERIVSVTSHVDESRASVISERYVEYEVKVPKKIVREEMIEKVIVKLEPVRLEETIEEVQKVREKIVEVAKPTIVEKVVEVPEIEWIERIVEIPEKVVQEKVVHVDKIQYEERINQVQKVFPQERIREIPEYVIRDVPVERVVEVPEYREEVIIREVPVPQYVDKPVPQEVQVEKFVDLERKIPVPVEAIVAYEYRMPRIKPRYSKVTYPVYLPRFIEIPVAVDLLNAGLLGHAENYLSQVQSLTRSATSLCEIEGLAAQIMKADLQAQLQSVDLQAAVLKAWQSNTIQTSSTTHTTHYGTANYGTSATYGTTAAIQGSASVGVSGAVSGAFTTSMATPLGATSGIVSVTREHKKSKKSSKHRA